jgi:hypothetical protein
MILVLGHHTSNAVGIEESPVAELVQNANPREDIEIVEFERLFLLAEGISFGCFGQVLSAGVFVEEIEAAFH